MSKTTKNQTANSSSKYAEEDDGDMAPAKCLSFPGKLCCCSRKKKPDKISLETLIQSIPDEINDKLSDNKNTFVMNVCMLCLLLNIVFQLGETQALLSIDLLGVVIFQWLVTVIAIGLTVAYYWKKVKQAVYPLLLVLTVRQSFALMDFELRRMRFDDFRLLIFEVS